jgi:hypothetical protein
MALAPYEETMTRRLGDDIDDDDIDDDDIDDEDDEDKLTR